MRYKNISAAFKASQGKTVIWYPFHLGGQRKDAWMWCAERDGEVLDYHRKNVLIDKALARGERVVVLTMHRDKTASITPVHKSKR